LEDSKEARGEQSGDLLAEKLVHSAPVQQEALLLYLAVFLPSREARCKGSLGVLFARGGDGMASQGLGIRLGPLATIIGEAVFFGVSQLLHALVFCHRFAWDGHEGTSLLIPTSGVCADESQERLRAHDARQQPAELMVGVVGVEIGGAGIVYDGQQEAGGIDGQKDELNGEAIAGASNGKHDR
jgi:hypothetical protein